MNRPRRPPANIAETLAKLLPRVAAEADNGRALQAVTKAALDLTSSQNAVLVTINEESGALEIRTAVRSDGGPSRPVMDSLVDPERREGVVGLVAATGAAVLLGDVRADPRYRELFADTISELAVPVQDRAGRIKAVLNLESERLDAYDDASLDIASALASLAAIVLERQARLLREEALIRVGSALGSVASEAALIDQVMAVAEDVLRLQACSIFLIDPVTERFVLRGSSGRLRDMVGQISYDADEGFTGWVCSSGKPILLDNPMSDRRWRGKYVEFPSEQVASFLAVPIVLRGKSVGAIRALRRKTDNRFYDNRFHDDDMRLLGAIAEQLASGLETVRSTERTIRNERLAAWGELSAKSSHMIGNRVFALKGDLNELRHVLGGDRPSIVEVRGLEESLSTNVRRLEEILQDFRDFVSATQLSCTLTDLNALVQETVAEVFPRRSNIELTVEYDLGLPYAFVDGKRLRRAVSELIENSLTHMESGRLAVRTRMAPAFENERTRDGAADMYARIEVQDSGPGVEASKKEQIFEPFYSGRVRGMGLGLSIVKGIVDAHSGIVYEAGCEGDGALFVILLPLETQALP
jgi:signal transduction histidine kinase